MKIGLFFGSFNPIHIGHLIVANTILNQTDMDQVWFVVSPQNPLKKSNTLLHEFDRLHMVRMAIDDNPQFSVTDIEFRMPRPSYTIDTLTYLSEKYKNHTFILIMGEDNLDNFSQWKNYEKIIEQYEVCMYPRIRSSFTSVAIPRLTFVKAPLLDISATFIRQSVKEGKSIKYLVPVEVESYILSNQFFR